jgi:hypothetical protein
MENETRFDVLTNFFGTSFLSDTIPSNSTLPTNVPLTDRSITLIDEHSKLINLNDYFTNELSKHSFNQQQQQQQQQPTNSQYLFNSNDSSFQSLELNADSETNEQLKHLYESIKETKKIWISFYEESNTKEHDDLEDENSCFEIVQDSCMILDSELDSISDYLVEMSKK